MITLVLPYPPSVNHYYRHVGSKTLISKEGRRYRSAVCRLVSDTGIDPLDGPIWMDIEINPPDKRRRDIDNVLKALLDSLQHGGAYKDDSQVEALSIEKLGPVEGGRTVVRFGRKI